MQNFSAIALSIWFLSNPDTAATMATQCNLIMALVSINDAAKLVRKPAATLTRDIEDGHLKKTVLQDGDIRLDTTELLRAYGQMPVHTPPKPAKPTKRAVNDKQKMALLEERNRSLERVIALEAELRRTKDQVSAELRARLADKEQAIKALENRIRQLEFEQQLHAVPTLDLTDPPADDAANAHHADDADGADDANNAGNFNNPPDRHQASLRRSWWSRVFGSARHSQP
jgi:hypothetical protein